MGAHLRSTMKFGKTLTEATQAEWVRHTVPYKLLKKHIKSLVEAGSPDAKRLFLEEVTDSAQKASAFFVSRVENVEELFALVHTDSVAALAADKNDGCDLQVRTAEPPSLLTSEHQCCLSASQRLSSEPKSLPT